MKYRLLNIFYNRDAEIEVLRKRLKMIEKNWEHLTEFYFVEDAPATNLRGESRTR